MSRTVLMLGGTLLLGLAPGCTGSFEARTRSTGYVVFEAPPPRRAAVERPAPPGPGAVWVEGHWVWDGSGYRWHRGHWARRRAGHIFVQPRWVRRGRGWVFEEGHWQRRRPPVDRQRRRPADRRGRSRRERK